MVVSRLASCPQGADEGGRELEGVCGGRGGRVVMVVCTVQVLCGDHGFGSLSGLFLI